MRPKQLALALILIFVMIAGLFVGHYRLVQAQVCAAGGICSSGFPESCIPSPTTLPVVNIHSAGPWYTEELNGHCGAGDCYIFLTCACGPPRGQRLCTNAEKGQL